MNDKGSKMGQIANKTFTEFISNRYRVKNAN